MMENSQQQKGHNPTSSEKIKDISQPDKKRTTTDSEKINIIIKKMGIMTSELDEYKNSIMKFQKENMHFLRDNLTKVLLRQNEAATQGRALNEELVAIMARLDTIDYATKIVQEKLTEE